MSWKYIISLAKSTLHILPLYMLCACVNVDYVDNDVMKDISIPGYSRQDVSSGRFGALVVGRTTDKNGAIIEPGRAFMLNKVNGGYAAETLLSDNTGNHKASFQRSYFSVGANKKNNSVGLTLRFVY